MRDDFLSRDWAVHHASLSDLVHRAIAAIRTSFDILHHKQFDAPWQAEHRPTCER